MVSLNRRLTSARREEWLPEAGGREGAGQRAGEMHSAVVEHVEGLW